MRQILYFLIGFCLSFIFFKAAYAGDINHGSYCTIEEAKQVILDNFGFVCTTCEWYEEPIYSNGLIKIHYYSAGYTLAQVIAAATHYARYPGSQAGCYYLSCPGCGTWGDSDSDGIPDGLDAYPDTDSAYQFRIMTNYFDSGGSCVAQLIVTSSGDYVLLGDLTSSEIEAGVSAGTYKSDFVNSPIWIDSSDLADDNASDIYSAGDSTTKVNSTTASNLTNSSIASDVNTLPTADGVTSGSTYDSGSDTDSSALGKIVDNTAAGASNQQTLANYAKKQTELQGTSNSLGLLQSMQLSQMNNTLEDQAKTAADEKTAQEQEVGEGKTALEDLNVDSLLGEDVNGELVEGEDGDYQDHGELMEETWVQELINSNPITTVLTNSGFEYSSGSPTATLNLGELGSHTLDISDLEAGLIAFGNLLVSFTTLCGLVHVITGRGF